MKDIKNITVNYDNNESKTITKGLVIDFGKLDNDEGDVCFNMCNIKGKDLHLIVNAVVAFAQELGMLDEEEREVVEAALKLMQNFDASMLTGALEMVTNADAKNTAKAELKYQVENSQDMADVRALKTSLSQIQFFVSSVNQYTAGVQTAAWTSRS